MIELPIHSNPVVIMHPDTFKELKKSSKDLHMNAKSLGFYYKGLPVVLNSSIEKEVETGRYVLPSGRSVEKNKVRVEFRFYSMDVNDLEILLLSGIVKKEKRSNVFIIENTEIGKTSFMGTPTNSK